MRSRTKGNAITGIPQIRGVLGILALGKSCVFYRSEPELRQTSPKNATIVSSACVEMCILITIPTSIS
ncbi:hypothetical protein LSAT2_021262 [Lamellibrachia satsuma]|nr:hypothetical protein LSAT2_021262 [Lamellibrachia satsuma]